MKSKIIVTGDNSKTLLIPELNETYHSTKGAITEAQHVFIQEGLHFSGQNPIRIFEMGFGTGLNAIITLNESKQNNLTIDYHCIESHPVEWETVKQIDYLGNLKLDQLIEEYEQMHQSETNAKVQMGTFAFTKYVQCIQELDIEPNYFDLIYYDAFGPKVQPELWGTPVLEKMHQLLKPAGFLVTYCAQGQFKRNLKSLGFKVESVPGPPGKREMTRAQK